MTSRRALWLVIGLSTALRLAWASTLGGFTNEAYYYLYANHLDWSYFDHPPMVGAVAALGLKLAPGASPIFGLRIGFVAMFAGSTWLLARLTERFYDPKAGVLAALALNATLYYGIRVGTLAEPDGPLLFFWLLTLERLSAAIDGAGRCSDWAGVGLAWGGAMMCKYYAALLPTGAVLYLFLRPAARRCLRTPGPYVATALGLAIFSPVIGWNARHGWTSFVFQGSRAGGFHGFQPATLAEALVAQSFYLTPWIWAWLVLILVRLARRGPRHWDDPEAFLACQAVPALALFLAVATFRRIMPHWPMIGYVALFPLLGVAWSRRLAISPRGQSLRLAALSVFPLVLGSLFVVQARTGWFQDGKGRLLGSIAPGLDPTVDTIRWDQIARELGRRGLLDDPATFLFTDHWKFSADLAMATRREAPVACYHRDSRSFTFWSRPEDWVGRDGIFVCVEESRDSVEHYAPWFTRVEPLASFPIVRAGVPLQTVRFYRFVRQTDPYPFGYDGPGTVPSPDSGPAVERPALVSRPDDGSLR